MIDLASSKLFTPFTHPESGVTVYLLTRKVAPVQEAFYFTNDSSAAGRYLWFYCAFPPSGTAGQGRSLGVVDFERQEVRHFPETQFNDASPFVDPDTGEATWASGMSLWRRGPGQEDATVRVNSLPEELVGARPVRKLATHLSRSVDRKCFFIDAQIGLGYVFGTLPIDGGDFQFWHRFDRNFNHALFNPVEPDLVLFAQENHPDPLTGLTFPIIDRMWLMRKGQAPRPLFSQPTRVTHEWWDPDGQHAWCVWGNETWKTNIHTQEVEKIPFPQHCWHSHSSFNGDYIIGDSNTRFYRGCPSLVHFLNRRTGKLVKLVDNPERPDYIGRAYHIDPHPRFVFGDQYVVFTTTMRGEIDVALARVADLIERTL